MNVREFKLLFPNATQSTIARNCPVGSVEDPERKRDERGKKEDQGVERCPPGVGYCVTIISLRRELVDGHDNLRWGAKPLVDRITETLGFASDDDPKLTWEYGQLKTEGVEGTIVRISLKS